MESDALEFLKLIGAARYQMKTSGSDVIDWTSMDGDDIYGMIRTHQEALLEGEAAKQVSSDKGVETGSVVSEATSNTNLETNNNGFAKRSLSAFKECKLPAQPITATLAIFLANITHEKFQTYIMEVRVNKWSLNECYEKLQIVGLQVEKKNEKELKKIAKIKNRSNGGGNANTNNDSNGNGNSNGNGSLKYNSKGLDKYGHFIDTSYFYNMSVLDKKKYTETRSKWLSQGKCEKKPYRGKDKDSDKEKEAENRLIKKIRSGMADEYEKAMKEEKEKDDTSEQSSSNDDINKGVMQTLRAKI